MSNGEPQRNSARLVIRRAITRFESLDDGMRIAIYVTLSLGAVGAAILVIHFRDEIASTAMWGLGLLAVVAVAAAIIIPLARMSERRREVSAQEAKAMAETRERLRREYLGRLQAIRDGRSRPISDAGGLFLRNSEVAWYRCRAFVGGREGPIPGELVVTSLRVVFVSPSPIDIPIANINAATVTRDSLHVVGKTSSYTVAFEVAEPEIAKAHIERCVLTYHRQVDVGFESGGSRSIPQDVKTAVFQRDGGKCAECGATDYLEFDHMIPFSKGGASTVDNLQLLCRRCNLKKRDRI